MSYLVLARKWRPQTFDDLVGQEHVSRTLANAIAQDRVAHAFLFTGVRGVGKTTSARILAKALCCVKGPTASPCLACGPCTDIASGSDVDVQEIDGASYTGVDDIRRLQESIPYRPARDRFKVFIVDEVHMLSTNAWNAFLKTLEEPPPHVKFIFATTEVHKVPVTILSRCQRYDFKLISAQLIAKRLRYVLGQEKIEADDAAIALVAREAAGSMRDAMSLLDQAIAWGGAKLSGEEVARVLGVAARSVLHEIATALVDGDAEPALRVIDALVAQGFDLPHVARDLLAHLRDLVVAKVCKDPSGLLDLPADEARDVVALSARADADDLIRLHQGFSRAFDDVARSGQPRAALEMALVRLARRPALLPIDDLAAQLADLERRLGGAPSPTPGGGSSGGPGGRPPAPPPSRTPSGPVAGGPPSRGYTSNAAVAPIRPAHDAPPSEARPSARAPDSSSRPAPASRQDAPPRSEPARVVSIASAAAPRAPEPRRSLDAAEGPVDLGAWRAIVQRVSAARQALGSVLLHAAPLVVSRERVLLGYEPEGFLAGRAMEDAAVELLTREVRAHFASPTAVAFELSGRARAMVTLASLDEDERRARTEAARKAVADNPLVKAAIEALGAELKDVRLPEID